MSSGPAQGERLILPCVDQQPVQPPAGVVLMHGNRTVSTKNLARQIGVKSVEPCKPAVASRHSGCFVGGTSPFGLKRAMPLWVQTRVLELPAIWINGGRRGFLVGVKPAVLTTPLGAKPVQCALAE